MASVRISIVPAVAAVLVAFAVLSVLPAAAQSPPETEAQPEEQPDEIAARLNEEGKALVEQKEFYKALEKFKEALKYFPLSNAIFNVGSVLFHLKHYEEAFPYIEQTLKAPLSTEQRAIVQTHRDTVLKELRHTHAALTARSNPPGAKLALNGKELPFQTPTRILVPFGTADLSVSAEGFKPQTTVIKSSPAAPPKDVMVRLEREEPDAAVSIHCPPGADVFVNGRMSGFQTVRQRLLIGDHVIRCGKTQKTAAFERAIAVKAGLANAFDFSGDKE
jgi:tetratricopeptide (TPR) repeat protein